MTTLRASHSLLSRLLRPRPIKSPLKNYSWTWSAAFTASHRGGFTRLPQDMLVEEENFSDWNKIERFYPVRIGDVFHSRYKVLAKLGFGTASTVWLCRELGTNEFRALKVCVAAHDPAEVHQELLVYRHIASVEGEHLGRYFVRTSQDDFQIESAQGVHQCLVFPPAGMTYKEFRNMLPGKVLDKELLQRALHRIAIGLDFLHQAGVVHTDLSPNNILLGNSDPSALSEIEQAEIDNPSSRKELHDRYVYVSQGMCITDGPLAITDFGTAKIGTNHTGCAMPTVYRAPEIILDMPWDCKIDTWALGVMIWDLFEGSPLFLKIKEEDEIINDEVHVAQMVSLMGPPPKEFLRRSPKCSRYWDSEGNWIAKTPIPKQSLEIRERQLEGTDQDLLLKLVRKLLRWLPEERGSAFDVLEDEFTLQYLSQDGTDGK